MNLLRASTFTDALGKLAPQEPKQVKLTAGLDPRDEDGVTIAGMHAAKGLEFRAVAVMSCDEDVLPDPARLAAIGDVADLEAAYETERHLLYVAYTRARDRLMISGVAPGSEFLDDIGGSTTSSVARL